MTATCERPRGARLGLISLGCDKNTVDSERILASVVRHGAVWTPEPAEAEVIVVNTCGFIDAAKEESIEMLLAALRQKEEGTCRAVVAVGCLVERYRDELVEALPEVDLFLGLRDLDRLVPELQARGLLVDPLAEHPGARLPVTGPPHVSFLKVSEGCDHGCAFCAIPLWRGKHRSFDRRALIAEAQSLEARGVTELNLVAQDLAHYGRDLPDRPSIANLLEDLLSQASIPWFRLLYIYSAGLNERLVELMAREPRILPYIDMPIQHASDRVLRAMRRPERADRLREKTKWLRASIPGLVLRTTVIVGFPGEEEEDFLRLLDFLQEMEFDHLGAFAFSPQPGTPAAAMPDQIPEGVRVERLRRLTEVQAAVEAARNADWIGRTVEAILDGVAEGGVAVARTRGQAYEIDGVTYVANVPGAARPGARLHVRVTGADDRDLFAEALEILPSAHAPRRRLPVLGLDLTSAFGR
ncbi:MAG: 30S ribosomal protein S12 methylthiotransferase RimO [Gemmatimonadetes bacterium]|nr:30S ribosomal protein S12 methylthiotransferase RimO [Gemmatimonadota bacterium]